MVSPKGTHGAVLSVKRVKQPSPEWTAYLVLALKGAFPLTQSRAKWRGVDRELAISQ